MISWPRRRSDTQSAIHPNQAIDRIRSAAQAIAQIRTAIDQAPRNFYIAELHLQMLKYADDLKHMTGKEFCEMLAIGPAYGTEFSKMLKISERLRSAGMDPRKI